VETLGPDFSMVRREIVKCKNIPCFDVAFVKLLWPFVVIGLIYCIACLMQMNPFTISVSV